MLSCKRSFPFFLFIPILSFVLMGCLVVTAAMYPQQGHTAKGSVLDMFGSDPVMNLLAMYPQQEYTARRSVLDTFGSDPVMNLLRTSFDDIIQVLGEPDEQGYSEWRGPHHYILFQHEQGVVRFASSGLLGDRISDSASLGLGQEVLGAKVGMLFSEIESILGPPDFGPELSMDNFYCMGYFLGEMNHGIPEVFISFSAVGINHPTHEAFVKWEAYDYGP